MTIYETLGIKPAINACGTVTRLGGSIMDPRVLEAMTEASRHFVSLPDLHRAAGRRIAELLKVEDCCVTCGAAAGLAIAAAASITRGDRAKILKLPDVSGMPDEILMIKCHRILYDQAARLSGATIREAGVTSYADVEMIEAEITGQTACFLYIAEAERMRGSVKLGDILPVMKRHGIPVIVDAAAELPPAANIHKYLNLGADMVVFSGGKELRGPQSSGLILGSSEWIAYCDQNCCPSYSIGRCMKIDKETIAGIVRAVELFVDKDYARIIPRWEAMCHRISQAFMANEYVTVREGYPTEPGIQPADLLRVYLRPLRRTAAALQEELSRAPTPVFIDVWNGELAINPQCLEEDEAEVLIDAISGLL